MDFGIVLGLLYQVLLAFTVDPLPDARLYLQISSALDITSSIQDSPEFLLNPNSTKVLGRSLRETNKNKTCSKFCIFQSLCGKFSSQNLLQVLWNRGTSLVSTKLALVQHDFSKTNSFSCQHLQHYRRLDALPCIVLPHHLFHHSLLFYLSLHILTTAMLGAGFLDLLQAIISRKHDANDVRPIDESACYNNDGTMDLELYNDDLE
jgi:hypothetical protein